MVQARLLSAGAREGLLKQEAEQALTVLFGKWHLYSLLLYSQKGLYQIK
jgi:hypothetical protein